MRIERIFSYFPDVAFAVCAVHSPFWSPTQLPRLVRSAVGLCLQCIRRLGVSANAHAVVELVRCECGATVCILLVFATLGEMASALGTACSTLRA